MLHAFKFLVISAALSFTLRGEALSAGNYTLDNSHTSVIFGISHLGYSYTYGRFNNVEGAFTWDDANPRASQFQIVIHAASIDSNDAARDDHLRGPDFFNANQFPGITFQSTSITPKTNKPGHFNLTGNLTMHGVTKQVTLPLRKLGEGNDPFGKYRAGFLCQTTIRRSEFGMTEMIPNIGDAVAVTISFEGILQGAPLAGSGSKAKAAGSGSKAKASGSGSKTKAPGSGSRRR